MPPIQTEPLTDNLQPTACRLSSSFTRIAAVVRLTLRDAVRSRVVISLLSALLLLLIGLPALVQGDGTPVGRLRILLEYALAAVVGLLSAATLWAGCATMASELQDRRLFVVLSKPVHRGEIWIGKWLGIVLLDAAALLAAGLIITTIVAVTRTAHPSSPEIAALLAARHTVLPQFPGNTPRPDADAARAPLPDACAVLPGDSLDMVFPMAGAPPTGPMELRVRLGSSRLERVPSASLWMLGPAGAPVAVLGLTNYPGLPVALSVPAAACGRDGVPIRFTNEKGADPATVIIDPRGGGLELLIPGGGFTANLLRGLAVVLARLAFLAALGVTAGSLLSLPVAVFMAVFVLVLLASAGYVETVAMTGVFYLPHDGELPVQGVMDRLILRGFRVMNAVTHPLLKLDPVPLLSDGRRVTWTMLATAAGLLGGAYVAVAGCFGIWRFTRREVGLSGTE
jgi:ABC-type Na+ efflux pump permease subunit